MVVVLWFTGLEVKYPLLAIHPSMHRFVLSSHIPVYPRVWHTMSMSVVTITQPKEGSVNANAVERLLRLFLLLAFLQIISIGSPF